MKKLGILFVLALMLGGVSAQAQKKNSRIQPAPPPVREWQCVQDEDGDGFFTFSMATGEFKCYMCEYKYIWDGKGEVKIDGFNIYFTALTDSYSMFVSLNIWDKQGKAVIEVYKAPDTRYDIEPIREYWSDFNIYNNSMDCSAPIK